MRNLMIYAIILLAAPIALAQAALGQSAQALAIPGAAVAKDVPDARELPDPNLTYKIVFDIAKGADKIDDVNPGLLGVSLYINTLAKHHVPVNHRKIVVVFHQGSTAIVVNNETFKARNDGHDNPNIALIRSMKAAGVDFRVCGQGILANQIDPKTIMPEIELDLWALVTITNLELRGYVHIAR